MGILDEVIGGLLGPQSSGSSNSGIGAALKELLAPNGQRTSSRETDLERPRRGGLDELLDRFASKGHGEVVDTWVGTGQNRSIAPNQLEQVLDRDTIESLSRRTGLSREELLRQLSDYLPKAVDRLTPEGRRPSSKDMGHW
jgi:uncharacterized protein YidB (DUF937 family)